MANKKILEEHSVKIYEIDPYIYENYEERIRVDENGQNYILFRIDVHFIKDNLAVEIGEKFWQKKIDDRDLIFEKKR